MSLVQFRITRDPHGCLEDTLALRGRLFDGYATQRRDGLEFDQYDTPAADYLTVYYLGRAVACVRLIPTNYPYMIQDLWCSYIDSSYRLPTTGSVVEVSRLGAERDVGVLLRGMVDYARTNGVHNYLFVANPRLLRRLLGREVPIYVIGAEVENGSYPCSIPLTESVLKSVEEKHAPKPDIER